MSTAERHSGPLLPDREGSRVGYGRVRVGPPSLCRTEAWSKAYGEARVVLLLPAVAGSGGERGPYAQKRRIWLAWPDVAEDLYYLDLSCYGVNYDYYRDERLARQPRRLILKVVQPPGDPETDYGEGILPRPIDPLLDSWWDWDIGERHQAVCGVMPDDLILVRLTTPKPCGRGRLWG